MSTAVEQKPSQQASPAAGVARLRASFRSGRTRPLDHRRSQLDGILRFLKEREAEIEAALREDMGRPSFEVYPSEIALCAAEAALARNKLRLLVQAQTCADLLGRPARNKPDLPGALGRRA